MNKNTIIRILKNLKESGAEEVAIDTVIGYLGQLHAPGAVHLPKSVHKFIQAHVKAGVDLQRTLNLFLVDKENREWIEQEHNQELFMCGYMFGSRPEQANKYLVKVKKLGEESGYLNCYTVLAEWVFSNKNENEHYRTHHTKEQLEEAGLGWVFNCSGIECIEVKEK